MNNPNVLQASQYKLKKPCRDQIEFKYACLDNQIPEDHRARKIWDFVEAMDTSICLEYVNSMSFSVGRPTTDPKVILALWIYTILDGNSSARKLEELCDNHEVYKWICGNISVNRTTLAQFRSHHPRKFDELLTSCLAVLVKSGLINDSDFSQDGTRVKANAGYNSFRRENTLKKIEADLTDYIKKIKLEEKSNPNSYEERQRRAKERLAIEKKQRVTEALKSLEAARCEKARNGKRNNKIPTEEELNDVRASTTDPDVRKMKMGDSGYRLAYNLQFATGLDSRVIYGLDVVNILDPGTAPIMMAQVQERLKKLGLNQIKKWIADSAYSAKIEIETTALLFPNCLYYAPPKPNKGIDPKIERKGDSEAVKQWRSMIDSEEIKTLYKKRVSTAEFSNMHVKNQALDEFSVRGILKVKGMAFLHAIAQNFARYMDLLIKKTEVIF
jgi:transposase